MMARAAAKGGLTHAAELVDEGVPMPAIREQFGHLAAAHSRCNNGKSASLAAVQHVHH